jgi:UDPglucose 6-dehydrogenase
MTKEKIAVIGCGKLGAPLIACFAQAGHPVLGIDVSSQLIEKLKINQIDWREPDLAETLGKYKDLITFENTYNEKFNDVSASFVIVPTPSNETGEYSLEFVLSAIEDIGKKLSQISFKSHIIVIVSTVMPGDTEGRIFRKLYESVGTNIDKISICYSPEFIALGSVIHNLQNPDTILIGQPNEQIGNKLQTLLLSIVLNKPKVLRMKIIEAEIAKIAINSYVTTKISFSNQISEICEKVPGTSAANVLDAIGSDSRIGQSYLRQGTSYGGPCFPRDNKAFAKFASNIGVSLNLAHSTDDINNRQNDRLNSVLQKIAPNAYNILIVGVSYKKDTDVIEESPALKFITKNTDYNLFICDDNVKNSPILKNVSFIELAEVADNSLDIDVAILFVPSSSYEGIPKYLKNNAKLIDFWGNWERYRNSKNYEYLKMGEYIG